VPRECYDGPAPRNCIVDEGPYAAATAALCSNIEHVLVRNEGRSPLDDLDRSFFLFDRPFRGLCATGLSHSFGKAMRSRNLRVSLGGGFGNLGLSYAGIELLPELLRSGRWLRLWREARALVASRRRRGGGFLPNPCGLWCPPALWFCLNRIPDGYADGAGSYSPIHPRRFAELDLPARARKRNLDLVYRPFKDSF